MATVEIKKVHPHPDGAVVIEPVDVSVQCILVKAEELAGRNPQPGDQWPVPEQQ